LFDLDTKGMPIKFTYNVAWTYYQNIKPRKIKPNEMPTFKLNDNQLNKLIN
jgi:hypothetical protein